MRIKNVVLPVAGSIREGVQPGQSGIDGRADATRTIVDTSIIELAIRESLRMGAQRLIFVTASSGTQVEALVRSIADRLATSGGHSAFTVEFVRQERRRGLGHAILITRPLLGGEAFAVVIPNLLVIGDEGGLPCLAEAYAEGSVVIGSTERPREKLRNFGVLEFNDDDSGHVRHIHEKPDGYEDRFSRASFGRWVFGDEIWEGLEQAEAQDGDEISLTTAINSLTDRLTVRAVPVGGLCFDTRQPEGLLQASIAYAMRRPELAEAVMDAQRDILDSGVTSLRARAWTERYQSLTSLALLAQLIEKELCQQGQAGERLIALTSLALLAQLIEKEFAGKIALVSSFGADSAVLLHMVSLVSKDTPVLFIETGKLFTETLDYQAELAKRLGLRDVRFARPDPQKVQTLDADGQLHQHDPDACCNLRKAEPLSAALQKFDCWITGRKRYQNVMRSDLELFEEEEGGRLKVNPLVSWTRDRQSQYMRDNDLPAHPLVARGYPSIGCLPCTTPVKEGEDERSGRWRGHDKTECGIHVVDGRVVRQA